MQPSNQRSPDAPPREADELASSASSGPAPSTPRDGSGQLPASGDDPFAELGGAAQAVQRWFEVLTDRAAASARRSLLRGAIALVVVVGATLWIGAASLALLRGLCGAFAALGGGSGWVGDLVGGAVAVAGACCALALALRVDSWARLRTLRAKYKRMASRSVGVETSGGTT